MYKHTLRSLSSSNFMESFCSSVIKSLVAMNLKSLSEDVIYSEKLQIIHSRHHHDLYLLQQMRYPSHLAG